MAALTRFLKSGSRPAIIALLLVGAGIIVAAPTCRGKTAPTEVGAVGTGGAVAKAVTADLAPDFQITLFSNANHKAGESLRLSDLRGRPVVVNFWFPSCPPCRLEFPDLERVFKKHQKDGVEFVGVQVLGLDSKKDGQEFVADFGVTFAIGPDEDGSIVKAYKPLGFPTTAFLDKEGRIVRRWSGLLNEAKLEEFVQELLE